MPARRVLDLWQTPPGKREKKKKRSTKLINVADLFFASSLWSSAKNQNDKNKQTQYTAFTYIVLVGIDIHTVEQLLHLRTPCILLAQLLGMLRFTDYLFVLVERLINFPEGIWPFLMKNNNGKRVCVM